MMYDFEMPGLNPMAQVFVPMNNVSVASSDLKNKSVLKELSHKKLELATFEHTQDISMTEPKKIPELTYDVLKHFPEKMTLPPTGIRFDEHLRTMIMTNYDCRDIPPELFKYMIDTGMIVLKK